MYTNYTPLHYSSTVRGISIRCMLMYKMVGTTVYEREREGLPVSRMCIYIYKVQGIYYIIYIYTQPPIVELRVCTTTNPM